MMDLSIVIIFALLQISTQPAEVYSSPTILEDTESSRVHHVLPRSPTDKNLFQNNLEWKLVEPPAEVPEDAVPVFDKKSKNTFYVARLEDCTPCFFDSAQKSCWVIEMYSEFSTGSAVENTKISFLVNKDKFEIFEWKKSSFGQIPPLPVETCNGYFIARNEFGLGHMTENSLMTLGGKKQDTTENEILTLNHDIKSHHINIIKYEIDQVKTSESTTVLKHFTASNKHCEPIKHQVKLDQGIDKTISLLKSHMLLRGRSGEISADGTIIIVHAAGKLTLKRERTHLNSETTSTANKELHSVNVEVQVPANHVCSIDIEANTITADIPVTAELTRIYNNNEIRRTTISDTYSHQEVTEIKALVNPCVELLEDKNLNCLKP